MYVTNLPRDAEMNELLERRGKRGVTGEGDKGEPKIKMYAHEDRTFSGEALVIFSGEDSATLALNLMDEAELRLGDGSTRMRVRRAEFGHEQQQGPGGQGGERKATKRIGKMQRSVSSVASW